MECQEPGVPLVGLEQTRLPTALYMPCIMLVVLALLLVRVLLMLLV